MHPTLVSFLPVKTYGFCMAAGFVICWKIIESLSGRKDLSNLIFSLMLAGVAGSRLAYVIEHWSTEFATRPLSVLFIWQGGLMFYGGLILAALAFFAWCFAKKVRAREMADLLCAVIPLGHAFGRVGCFFYGCCFGGVSSSPLAVRFPAHSPAWYDQVSRGLIAPSATESLPVLPTQLFEAAALLALFAIVFALFRRFGSRSVSARAARLGLCGRPGLVAGAYFALYALIRFALECLRGDERAAVGALSISQAISLGVFAFGALLLTTARREGPPSPETTT